MPNDDFKSIHKGHQVLGASGAHNTAAWYVKALLQGRYVRDSGREYTNLYANSAMYAYDWAKSAIDAPNNDGQKTPSGSGYKLSYIDYYLYMKICLYEKSLLWGTMTRTWTQDISIMSKYSTYKHQGYDYPVLGHVKHWIPAPDEYEIFHPEWHLRWQMTIMKNVIMPDFDRWMDAGMPLNWNPRVEKDGDPEFDGSLRYYARQANKIPDSGTEKGDLIYYFVKFYKEVILYNASGTKLAKKLGIGPGINEWVGYFAPLSMHAIRESTGNYILSNMPIGGPLAPAVIKMVYGGDAGILASKGWREIYLQGGTGPAGYGSSGNAASWTIGNSIEGAGNWKTFLTAKIEGDHTAENNIGGNDKMSYFWGKYLLALDAGSKEVELDLIGKGDFVKMCFDFAEDAISKIKYVDINRNKFEFNVNDPSEADYHFPKSYKTRGYGSNIAHHVASMFMKTVEPLKFNKDGPKPWDNGPHILSHTKGAKIWSWEIVTPQDIINGFSFNPAAPTNTVLTEDRKTAITEQYEDIYDQLEREIYAKANSEGAPDTFRLEHPDKEIILTKSQVLANGKPSEAQMKFGAMFGKGTHKNLQAAGVELGDIRKMLATFKQKQPEQFAEITRERPLHEALPVKRANAKIDKAWSAYFKYVYNDTYHSMMKIHLYETMEPPLLFDQQDTGTTEYQSALLRSKDQYYGPVYENNYERMGLDLTKLGRIRVIPPVGVVARDTLTKERRLFIVDHLSSPRKVATAMARDVGLCLTAFIGATWMQSFYNRMAAKALLKGGDIGLTENDLDAAEGAALGDTLADPSLDLTDPMATEPGMDEKTIQKRFDDFYKQCALLGVMEQLATSQDFLVMIHCNNHKNSPDEFHKNGIPYNGRFWMLQDGGSIEVHEVPEGENGPIYGSSGIDQNGLSTKMLVPRSLKGFESLTPAALSMLTPMLRLYLVFKKDGQERQIEFEFPQGGLGSGDQSQSPFERLQNMMNSSFDRGNGAGIKNCVIEFNGTSPASARNDIKVNLTLYFQTFADFFRERHSPNGKYSFSDLVVYPSYKGRADGRGEQGSNEYNPSNFKVKMEVGWMPPDGATQRAIEKATGVAGSGQALADEIGRINKTYLLNRVGEDIQLKEDGSVDINIEFRAYVESIMKMNDLDALTSPRVHEMKKQRQKTIDDAVKNSQCSESELKMIKQALQGEDEKIGNIARRSIMTRLIESGKIFAADIKESSKIDFEDHGFFTIKPEIVPGTLKKSEGDLQAPINAKQKEKEMSEANPSTNKDFLLITGNSKKPGKWMDEELEANTRINFFFLGDLVHILLDTLYMDEDNKSTTAPNLSQKYEKKRIKLILGSFNYYDFEGQIRVANIANIPISCDYFYEWMTEHVVKQKRVAYPIINFIRDLCNNFLSELMGSICQNQSQQSSIYFYTMPLYTSPKGTSKKEPFQEAFDKNNIDSEGDVIRTYIDAGLEYTGNPDDVLPLSSDALSDPSDMMSYMFVYSYITPHLTPVGNGDIQQDMSRGVHHFHIGAPRGLVKKMSFTKTDIAYLRESRFLSQGDLGIAQLGAVYNVNIDMIGNTIYYPGMECYVDPLGIGGTEFGSPSAGGQYDDEKQSYTGRSIANAMGFGGYHSILKVKSDISPGKFNTTVTAQWVHSGDGKRGVRVGKKQTDEAAEKIKVNEATMTDDCRNVYDQVMEQTRVGRLSKAEQQKIENMEQAKEKERKRLEEINQQRTAAAEQVSSTVSNYISEAEATSTDKEPN